MQGINKGSCQRWEIGNGGRREESKCINEKGKLIGRNSCGKAGKGRAKQQKVERSKVQNLLQDNAEFLFNV